MSHYLVIGYPRTGTTSVVDMLLKEHGHYNNFVQDLKYNGVEKWFAAEKSVAKMHTHREFKMYGPHLQKIIDRTDKVYYTKLRKDLAAHLISYLCIYLCRLDDQADPVWQLNFKVEFPITNQVAKEQMYRLADAMIGLKPKLETYKCLPWKDSQTIDVFSGECPVHVNSWSKYLTTEYFKDPDKVKEYSIEYARMLSDEGIN